MKIVLAATVCLCVAFAGKAYACQCSLVDPKSEIRAADAIFRGIVVRAELLPNEKPSSTDIPVLFVGKRFRFMLGRAYKGILGKEVEIETGTGAGDCGYKFELGRPYLVFGYREGKRLVASICSNTGPLDTPVFVRSPELEGRTWDVVKLLEKMR